MRRPLAALATLLIMGGMLWMSLARRDPPAPDSLTGPQASSGGDPRRQSDLRSASARIETLLEVARRGDLAAYLASFDNPLRGRLEQQADQRGRAAFADELRRAARARKSHAIFAPVADGEGPDTARILVESIFADRIERQTYRLARRQAAWLITEVETARDREPSEPLGSLAAFHEPEGVPVATEEMTSRLIDSEENY